MTCQIVRKWKTSMTSQTNDSVFVKHIPCEECGSKDNRGVWSDGHEFCFGCSDHKASPISYKLNPLPLIHKSGVINLPTDFTLTIDKEALAWLYSYGITPTEIRKYKMGWSPSRHLLIYPFWNESTLTGYQGRSFGPSGSGATKYFNVGDKSKWSQVVGAGETLVFTEDFISAIKVARHTAAVCLFGVTLQQALLSSLGHSHHYIIWLDKDKRSYAMEQAKKYSQYGYNITAMFSDKDPKEYTDKQIQEMIHD
jgi:hypothetical protein